MDAIIKTRLVRAGYKPLSKMLISGGYQGENNYIHCRNMLTMRHAGKKRKEEEVEREGQRSAHHQKKSPCLNLGKPKRGKMEDYGLPSLELSLSDLWESASIVPIDSQH